jgi:hypothetical protein
LARNAWTTLENDRSGHLPADLRRSLPAGCAPLSNARLPAPLIAPLSLRERGRGEGKAIAASASDPAPAPDSDPVPVVGFREVPSRPPSQPLWVLLSPVEWLSGPNGIAPIPQILDIAASRGPP